MRQVLNYERLKGRMVLRKAKEAKRISVKRFVTAVRLDRCQTSELLSTE